MSHEWKRFDTIFHRCTRCGWGWKMDADNDFPCPGFNMIAEDRERIARKIEVMTSMEHGEWDSTYSAEPGVMVEPLLAWLRR